MLTESKKVSLLKNHPYKTRHKNKPNRPLATNSSYYNSFLCKSIRDFETLSVVTQQIKSLLLFVQKAKHSILHDNH